MAGLYIHIPFCKSRCIYCAFYSSTLSELQDGYTEALCREMVLRPATEPISTIYLGGGTPSVLSAENLHSIFNNIYKVYFPHSASNDDQWAAMRSCEVTMECNPDDIDDAFCHTLRALPVNRISMGVQTFDNQRLRFLHRRHSAEDVELAMARLRKAGIANISIDLMFGFPGQTLDQWSTDIDKALALKPEHISAYGLTYEENTPLYNMVYGQNRLAPISDELSLDMYEHLIDRLEACDYEHYEISNFALGQNKYRSRHNSSYWNNIPYIGLGAAAHSYDLNTRSWNVADLRRYIDSISMSQLPSEGETITPVTAYNDMITTALRTCEGVSIKQITPSLRSYFIETAGRLAQKGLLELTDHSARLTRKGLYLSDTVMSELVYVE